MDTQPVDENSNSNSNNQSQQPIAQDAQLNQPTGDIPKPQPVPVYPTPNTGLSAPTFSANSAIAAANSFKPTTLSDITTYGVLPLILACLAVGVLPLLIFAPSLVGSRNMMWVWLSVVTFLSIAGLVLAKRALKKASTTTDTNALVALILSTIMLVGCLIYASSYIKLQLTINSYKNRYNSNSIF